MQIAVGQNTQDFYRPPTEGQTTGIPANEWVPISSREGVWMRVPICRCWTHQPIDTAGTFYCPAHGYIRESHD